MCDEENQSLTHIMCKQRAHKKLLCLLVLRYEVHSVLLNLHILFHTVLFCFIGGSRGYEVHSVLLIEPTRKMVQEQQKINI